MNKKNAEFSSLKQSLFSCSTQLFETWAMYHLNVLENDESISIDRLHVRNCTSQEDNDWKREAKRLNNLERKRQRDKIQEELEESRERKRLRKAREKAEHERE